MTRQAGSINHYFSMLSAVSPKKQKQWNLHPLFVWIVLPIAVFFVIAAWSPPLFYSTITEWHQSWHKAMFSYVCHQNIDRSYIIGGIPQAVCSRCAGIYSGLFLGLAFFSNFPAFVDNSKHFIIRIFIVVSLILVLDGFANLFQIWHTGNHARSMVGLFWGIMTGTLLVFAQLIPRNT